MDAALDAGITLFDTADSYGGTRSEEFLGRALGSRRDEAIVATKFGSPIDDERKGGASAAYIARAVEDSLKRLGTDRIDLYQLHFPDAATPFEETIEALDTLVRDGKVLEIGGSNFSAEQIDETHADQRRSEAGTVRERAERVQPAAARTRALRCARRLRARTGSCSFRTSRSRAACSRASTTVTRRRPRAPGSPGCPRSASTARCRPRSSIASKRSTAGPRDHGHTLLELAIAWLLARPTVASVIAGATKPEQVQANAAAAAWTLTDADLGEIDALLERARRRRSSRP